MRSPNGQSCCLGSSLASSLEFALVMAGDTVWRCESIFEQSVKTGAPATFEFRDIELALLAQFYPDIDKEASRVKTFLNRVILMQKKMPYKISTILHMAGTNRFSCRMVKESSVYDL
jgi:hypothetical protein